MSKQSAFKFSESDLFGRGWLDRIMQGVDIMDAPKLIHEDHENLIVYVARGHMEPTQRGWACYLLGHFDSRLAAGTLIQIAGRDKEDFVRMEAVSALIIQAAALRPDSWILLDDIRKDLSRNMLKEFLSEVYLVVSEKFADDGYANRQMLRILLDEMEKGSPKIKNHIAGILADVQVRSPGDVLKVLSCADRSGILGNSNIGEFRRNHANILDRGGSA